MDSCRPRRCETRRFNRVIVYWKQSCCIYPRITKKAVVDYRSKIDVVVKREGLVGNGNIIVHVIGTKGVAIELKGREADVARVARIHGERRGRHSVKRCSTALHRNVGNDIALVSRTVVARPEAELHFKIARILSQQVRNRKRRRVHSLSWRNTHVVGEGSNFIAQKGNHGLSALNGKPQHVAVRPCYHRKGDGSQSTIGSWPCVQLGIVPVVQNNRTRTCLFCEVDL